MDTLKSVGNGLAFVLWALVVLVVNVLGALFSWASFALGIGLLYSIWHALCK